MELRLSYGFPTPLPCQKSGRAQNHEVSTGPAPVKVGQESSTQTHQIPSNPIKGGLEQTRLIYEAQEAVESGQRRMRIFEQADGRRFTRVEEISQSSPGRAQRVVTQQNPSGGTTRYEEVLDREPSGTFRRIQRFQNEAGETTALVTPGYKVTDPSILFGGGNFPFESPAPYSASRGTQLDLSA
jgi:hypothetical protein